MVNGPCPETPNPETQTMQIYSHQYLPRTGELKYGCEEHALEEWADLAEPLAKHHEPKDWQFHRDLILALIERYTSETPIPDALRDKAIAERMGYWYALKIDECPREDTRAAAIAEGWVYYYARDVDKCPREDTRVAAIAEGWESLYTHHFGTPSLLS